MAAAWRSVGTYVSRSGVNTNTVTVPQPAGHQAGDLLLLVAGTFNSTTGATINTPSGWTLLAAGGPYNSNVGAGNYYVAVFYKIAASSSEASVSMTTSAASYLDCQITAFSGGDGTTPIDANTTWQRGGVSSTTFPFQAITTLTNNALLVYLAGDFDGSAYNTPPTGATERSESTTFAVKFIVATETKTSAGTEAADSYTKASGADGGSGIVIALREAGASAAPLTRPATNYIAGAGITVTAADNPTLDAVDVTIASTVTGLPAVVNGQWVKGSGGVPVWAAITEADVTNLVTDLAAKQATSAKGAANGYASLDAGTKVPVAQIPNTLLAGYQYTLTPVTTTSTSTATSEAGAGSVVVSTAVTLDGTTGILVEFYCPWVAHDTAGGVVVLTLFEDATALGELARVDIAAAGGRSAPGVLMVGRIPASGTHTWTVKFWGSAGTKSVVAGPGGTGQPVNGFIRVRRA